MSIAHARHAMPGRRCPEAALSLLGTRLRFVGTTRTNWQLMTPEQMDDYARGYHDARVVVREVGLEIARRWMRTLIARTGDATAPYLLGVSDLVSDTENGAKHETSGAD